MENKTFFCVDTYSYGQRNVFSTIEAVKRFIQECERNNVYWKLWTATFFDGELLTSFEPLTTCRFIDEDGGLDAVLERLEVAA